MFSEYKIRQAEIKDTDTIWQLLQAGILKRKEEGSTQWQDGYPNLDVVTNDIANQYGIVVEDENHQIVAYIAMIDGVEPAYEELEGKWLSGQPYIVFHRLIVNLSNPVKGFATWFMTQLEKFVLEKDIYSIKVDTNFDNVAMLRVFEKLDYQYCGKVYFRGSERLAFEKILN